MINDFSILLVDDEQEILEYFSFILKDKYSRIYTALNGKEALKLLENETIDCAVIDLMMPCMNGFELLKSMKATYPSIFMIICTAVLVSQEQVDTMMEFGVSGFLFKPLQRTELLQTIENIYNIHIQKKKILKNNQKK